MENDGKEGQWNAAQFQPKKKSQLFHSQIREKISVKITKLEIALMVILENFTHILQIGIIYRRKGFSLANLGSVKWKVFSRPKEIHPTKLNNNNNNIKS